jgi:stage II sporulation protein D
MKNQFRRLFLLIIALAISYQSSIINCPASSMHYIRVAIIQDASSLNLKINGFCEVVDANTNKVLYRGKNLKTTITTYGAEILMAARVLKTPRIVIKTDKPVPIIINGRTFKGEINLIRKTNDSLLVINRVDLDDYVKGILYHESSHYWPQDALKAQAVVSRTYAVYQMQKNKLKDYDLTSDIYSQVYGGKTSERYRTSAAVDDTRGEVLTYNDKIIPAYFHATCAGHTEDASLLWNIDIVPLKGVICVFCKDSPHFRWHNTVSLKDIAEKLTAAGYRIKDIRDIRILGKDKSGRITDLSIVSDEKNIKISAKDFRNIIGNNFIRSTNFQVTIAETDAVFEGLGWGHGVGLCQWGAYFMAKQGYTYKDILRYYYPNTNVRAI